MLKVPGFSVSVFVCYDYHCYSHRCIEQRT
uniref:Uncharacterized protein n=1 Tax=Arundo donax TaxID=35708 RepID=A0A0A9BEC8_ARUDO